MSSSSIRLHSHRLEKNNSTKNTKEKIPQNYAFRRKTYRGSPFQWYSENEKKTMPKVNFEQFWNVIQRIQIEQALIPLLKANMPFSNQNYSLPSTILDNIIKNCSSLILSYLSKTCSGLSYLIRKIRGRCVGYLTLGDGTVGRAKFTTDIGISLTAHENFVKKEMLLNCSYETPNFLKNIVCEGTLEIWKPNGQNLFEKQEKLARALSRIKKLQHKALILHPWNDRLTNIFTEVHYLKLFHENLTELDMLGVNISFKYLSLLKNCDSIKFNTRFEESEEELETVLAFWKPEKKFEKFVIQVDCERIPQSFINFISKSMSKKNSIFAISVPIYFVFFDENIDLESQEEILHSLFCQYFDYAYSRKCYAYTGFGEHGYDTLGYQITFGYAEFCKNIFIKNSKSHRSCNQTWLHICSLTNIL